MILFTAGIEAVSRGLKQSTENPAATQNTQLQRLREFFWRSRREDLQRRLRAMTADAMYCVGTKGQLEIEYWTRLSGRVHFLLEVCIWRNVDVTLRSFQNITLLSPQWRFLTGLETVSCGPCSCGKCGVSLSITSNDLYPPDTYFEAGNRGTLSFMEVDMSKFRKQKEKRWRSCFPFFDSLDSWGIQRKRTQLRCVSCNMLLGFIYYDMPRRSGQSSFGSLPKGERYRLKMKALQEAPVFHQKWQ